MKRKLSKTVKATKAPVAKKAKPAAKKRCAVKKDEPRWKVVGDKVVFKPGRYTVADIEAAIRALGGSK